jgi:hypothetical protein
MPTRSAPGSHLGRDHALILGARVAEGAQHFSLAETRLAEFL